MEEPRSEAGVICHETNTRSESNPKMKALATALYPFIPSGADFAASLNFFLKLGFEKVWEQSGLAGLRFGQAQFILQNINVPQWQQNQMITLEVTDLDAYWSEVQSLDLSKAFSGVKFKPPTPYAWGREMHFIDPAGVCWHVRQTSMTEPR
jgi:hypothetical protein